MDVESSVFYCILCYSFHRIDPIHRFVIQSDRSLFAAQIILMNNNQVCVADCFRCSESQSLKTYSSTMVAPTYNLSKTCCNLYLYQDFIYVSKHVSITRYLIFYSIALNGLIRSIYFSYIYNSVLSIVY